MLKKIFAGLVAILLIAILYTMTLPAAYSISSEMVIHKAPSVIFEFLNNSEKNMDWMPWKANDPDMKLSFEGPTSGVGSKATWTSKGSMRVGSSEIIESIPFQYVKFRLIYKEPMSMEQSATLQVLGMDSSSKVIWSAAGENPFIGRLFFKLFGVENQVSQEFAKGLMNLKLLVEKVEPE
jgi:hypothetical protein